jgi:uncharacterized protein with FMN-binding domain
MKKTLVIIFAVAILGVLATFTLAPQKPVVGKASTPVITTTTQPSTAQNTVAQPSSNMMAQSGKYKDGTYTGSTESNPYDVVQVKMVVSGGKISDITLAQLTADGRQSNEIVNYAIPRLKNQALSAQSASIDGVSGATYISQSYASSLQAAIDKAAM